MTANHKECPALLLEPLPRFALEQSVVPTPANEVVSPTPVNLYALKKMPLNNDMVDKIATIYVRLALSLVFF